MEQYKIEIAVADQGKFFDITPLGDDHYKISHEGETLGTIQLDQKDHSSCRSQGCELDMPVLHAIREGIQYHQQWKERNNKSDHTPNES